MQNGFIESFNGRRRDELLNDYEAIARSVCSHPSAAALANWRQIRAAKSRLGSTLPETFLYARQTLSLYSVR